MFKNFLKSIVVLSLFQCLSLFGDNIGLCITATGKYIQFVDPLIESAEKYFCKTHNVTYFVFTDSGRQSTDKVIYLYHPKIGWPFDTMMRSKAYFTESEALKTQDYLYAVDADMLFVNVVGDEILGERVATIHPGQYWRKRPEYTYDTNPQSKACIYPHEGTHYFCGGFYGGNTEEFLKIVETISANIDDDLNRGVIACWHDESHWNRYCIDHKPTIILNAGYCYCYGVPFTPRLIPLEKNHNEMRQ